MRSCKVFGWKLLAVLAATIMLSTTPMTADASTDDSFWVGYCSFVMFDDYGPGVPGNGESNDDYIEIADQCYDDLGVRAYAWLDGRYLGSKYNGNGAAGASVIWDPFGDVLPGQDVGLKSCLVNGPNGAPFTSTCVWDTREITDG